MIYECINTQLCRLLINVSLEPSDLVMQLNDAYDTIHISKGCNNNILNYEDVALTNLVRCLIPWMKGGIMLKRRPYVAYCSNLMVICT